MEVSPIFMDSGELWCPKQSNPIEYSKTDDYYLEKLDFGGLQIFPVYRSPISI